jgi:glyoxylase-like metal-dependent hydrolase (beta-lactamase superfamily II)
MLCPHDVGWLTGCGWHSDVSAFPQTRAGSGDAGTDTGKKSHYSRMVPTVPTSYRRLQEGIDLTIHQRRWQIITGFGHSPEHASLYCADLNILISGDMLLPRISTNVSVFAIEPEANPVQQYLDSLKKYLPLPEDVLILPSHGKPFKGCIRASRNWKNITRNAWPRSLRLVRRRNQPVTSCH